MLKIPFIERTLIGVHIDNNYLYWVEATKLANRISVVASGTIEICDSLESTISEFKESLHSDAYYLGISMPMLLREVMVEEVSIPEDEAEEWIQNYTNNKKTEYENLDTDLITNFIELDEDLFRVINLVYDQTEAKKVQTILEHCELFPAHMSSGFFENGYSQVLNSDFTDGFASTISNHLENPYLVIFNDGRATQAHSLEASESIEMLIEQCDSVLKTEELNYELNLDSIPLYCKNNVHRFSLKREIKDFTFNEISKKDDNGDYNSVALGAVMKLAFPQLDTINLIKEKPSLTAQWHYTKKELIRLSVLLFAPLIIFTLIAYASNKIIETNLFELTQVYEKVSGNLAVVELELEKVAELQDKFQTLSKDVQQKIYVTEIFEIIASIIPKEVWLTEFKASTDNKRLEIELSGISANASSISTFQRNCQNLETTSSVQLVSTELVSENGKLTAHVKFQMRIQF